MPGSSNLVAKVERAVAVAVVVMKAVVAMAAWATAAMAVMTAAVAMAAVLETGKRWQLHPSRMLPPIFCLVLAMLQWLRCRGSSIETTLGAISGIAQNDRNVSIFFATCRENCSTCFLM
jgi:hypothetical protein